jgi:hypothetical protein
MSRFSVILLALALILAAPAVYAQGKSQGKGNKGKSNDADIQIQIPGTKDMLKVTTPGWPKISVSDIDIIRRYYRSYPNAFGSVKPLPPGIQKNLARGKPMPPGIAKTRFPNGLLTQLPSYSGYQWTLVGNDIALVAAATNVIVDLFDNAF